MHFEQINCNTEKLEYPGGEGILILGNGQNPPESYKGNVQCVYLDPPFRTGNMFSMRMKVGQEGWTSGTPSITLPAYSDRFPSREDFLQLLRGLVKAAHDLLKESGAFFLHLGYKEAPYARVLCDEIFGENNFVNEIIWSYQTGGRTMRRFSNKHDIILFYQKSDALYFNMRSIPVSRAENRQNHMKKLVDEKGRTYRTIRSGGKTYYYYDDDPTYPGDVWADVSHLQQKDPQRTGYDTQKPIALLSRIISCSTKPGDWVADLCCGSGTTLAAALGLGRRFLGIDASPLAISVSRKRLTSSALTVSWPFGLPNAHLEAQVENTIGFYLITLTGYHTEDSDAYGFSWQDTIDQWAIGFYIDDVFHAYNFYARTKKTPVFSETLNMPMFSGKLAISIIDIWGNRSVWVMEDNSQ